MSNSTILYYYLNSHLLKFLSHLIFPKPDFKFGIATAIINNAPMLTAPPQNYLEACLLGHEEEYYWAMVISHGDRYFEKGFSYAAPDSYDEWESKYINDNNLKTNTLIFKDES